MIPMAYKWLADENFPFPAFHVLRSAGWDINHIGAESGGLPDTEVMKIAIHEERILLTFDGDHGTLIFKDGFRPLGIVYFRLTDYFPDFPGHFLLKLLQKDWPFYGFITVVENDVMRQRAIPDTPPDQRLP